jgi:hypothetical protein
MPNYFDALRFLVLNARRETTHLLEGSSVIMDNQFTGLPQRRSIMNPCWLRHACILLAVGVGLVSCKIIQKDHVMTQPAAVDQSLRPCQSTEASSITTPELCVNVMEMQLSNEGTTADVGLSLVNRTGGRLFMTLTGPTSLTDSNGRTWNTGDSKGLGNLSNPVPLEPRGEIQGTITFHQIGQSPIDLTFSLVGEIGIMKMGSRGQVVPGQIARKHPITLSGIRIRHQLPQSTGATEQNKGAKLTHVFPRRTKPTTPTSSASSKSSAPGAVVEASGSGKSSSQKPALSNASRSPDKKSRTIDPPAGDAAKHNHESKSVGSVEVGPHVFGLRIGMTPNQARKVFTSHGLGSSIKSPYTEGSSRLTFSLPGQAPQPVPNTNYVTRISGSLIDIKSPATESSGVVLTVFFGPIPGQEGIASLNLTEYIPVSKEPTVTAFTKTLLEKYGTPTELPPDSPGIYRWRYDSNGALVKPAPATRFAGCPRLRPGTIEFQPLESPQMIQGYKQSVPRCGAIFLEVALGFEGFNYAGPETLIKNYTTHMTGLDATVRALETAKGIVDMAQAEASGAVVARGKQQKPDL